jgi:hypothetical protein
MDLVFSAKKINEIEKESRVAFQDLLAKFSVQTLVMFLKKGLDLKTEDEAFDAIDNFVKEDPEKNDSFELYFKIIEALQAYGFLPKALKVEDLKKQLYTELQKGLEVKA